MGNKYSKKRKMRQKIERNGGPVPTKIYRGSNLGKKYPTPRTPGLTPIEATFRQVNPDYVPSRVFFAENTHLVAPYSDKKVKKSVRPTYN